MRRRALVVVAVVAFLGGMVMAQDAKSPKRKVLDITLQRDVSTIIETFRPTLKAAGKEWSTARLMGTFGYAFAFSMDKATGEVWQTSGIDWMHFFGPLKNVGFETDVYEGSLKGPKPVSPERFRELKERAWPSVKASIDRGVPALLLFPGRRGL